MQTRVTLLKQPLSARVWNEGDVSRMRRIIGHAHPPATVAPAEKNPPAVFILSPMRSGSTLLRIMLAGNPRLFSPPELQLLQFDTLAGRHDALTGFESSMQEGTVRGSCNCAASTGPPRRR